MRRWGAGLIIAAGLVLGGWWGSNIPSPPARTITITPAVPQRIRIEKLNVDAAIEGVAKDKEGLMEVPINASDAGWYSLGVKPGEKGNAVIDGHINNQELRPEIFYNLDKLEPGDKVTITDEEKNQWNFTVIKRARLPDKDFPVEEVFGNSDQPKLNLITCSGKWDKERETYNERLVVYTILTK